MSFDQLLSHRPNYTSRKTLQPLLIQTKATNFPRIMTDILKKQEPIKQTTRTIIHKKNESNKSSQSYSVKKQKVQEAYNQLSDFNDKKQIVASLKLLSSADERIQLIDKILERKEEMMVAQLKLKAVKLEPIFNVIRRKLKKHRQGSATTNRSNRQTIILRQKTSEYFQNTNNNSKDSKDINSNSNQELISEDQIIEKLQTKFTANIAFSWLANRHDGKQIHLTSETGERQYLRRATALQYGKDTINRLNHQVSKKVAESSTELIKQGNQQFELKREKIEPQKVKAKVDSGLGKLKTQTNLFQPNIQKRQKTLIYVTTDRKGSSHNHIITEI